MPDSNEDQKTAEPLKQNKKIAEKDLLQAQIPPDATKGNFIVTSFIAAVAILALIIAVYTVQLSHKLQTKIVDGSGSINVQLSELKQSQTETKELFNTTTDTMQQIQNKMQDELNNLNKQIRTAASQQHYQNQDWLLLKARYYLELAQINTHWSDNFKSSIALLQQADNLLKLVNEPGIFDIRQIIAKEIAQLQSTTTLDIAGLLSKLDAAQSSVSRLTIPSTIEKNKAETENDVSKESNPGAWQKRFQDSINSLKNLVIIRRNDEDFKPLLSPVFEAISRESIGLNVQEAQWAILNNNQTVYQLAINQAITNIKRTFGEETQVAVALLKELNELNKIKLNLEKPVVGIALPLLNQIINKKNDVLRK